jgi:hypothetical protein
MVIQPGRAVVGAVNSAPATGPTISDMTSDSTVVELTTCIDLLTKISDKYDSAADFPQHHAINHQKGGVR